MPTHRALDDISAAATVRGLPPVHLWNPQTCGEIDIVIKASGDWLHEGALIARPALVRLFSTVLRRDPDGVYLVTPVERVGMIGPGVFLRIAPEVSWSWNMAGEPVGESWYPARKVAHGAARSTAARGVDAEAAPDHVFAGQGPLPRGVAGEGFEPS